MNTIAYHLYVQVNGDDAHADGTPQHPFATLQKAKEYVKTLDKSKGDIVVEIGDGGAIYSIGAMPNTVISENYICKIGTEGVKPTYHIRGIHPDEGTAGIYGEKNVIDINPEFVCIDCGDWGKKGGNVWDNNYATSALYANLKNLEPGTRITNKHTVTEGNWDETAKSVMENAGIQAEYLKNMPDEIVNDNSEPIASIPTCKRKIR